MIPYFSINDSAYEDAILEQITEILKNTWITQKKGNDVTLSSFLNLDCPDGSFVREYAEKLYQQSTGHPGTIAATLQKRCEEIRRRSEPLEVRPDFVSAEEESVVFSSNEMELLEETAFRFNSVIRRYLKECEKERADLSEMRCVNGFDFEHLLAPLRIASKRFSGGSIQLTIPDRVRLALEAMVSPYYDYLKDVESLSTVPIDFPLAFELLLVSVFRHWFAPPKTVDAEENAEPKKPKEISDFFFDTPIFGNWEEFACYGNFLNSPE